MNIALQRSDQAVDVLIGLREQQIHIESMTVQKPSLDEVFLALTGHDTSESRRRDGDPAEQPDHPTTRTTWRRSDDHAHPHPRAAPRPPGSRPTSAWPTRSARR